MRTLSCISVGFFVPWAMTTGLLFPFQTVFADTTAGTTSTQSNSAARSQKSDRDVKAAPTFNDDEIFDRDLTPTSQQMARPAVGVQGCTTLPICPNPPGTNSGLLNQYPPGFEPSTGAGQSLTNPDSVFSQQQQQQQSQMPSPVSALSAGQGAATSMSYVPSFMGDFYAGAPMMVTSVSQPPIVTPPPIVTQPSSPPRELGPQIAIPHTPDPHLSSVSMPGMGGVGIMKMAENTSPLPRDRVFLSYNYFSDVNLVPGGMPVNRITPGVEKTFFGGNASIEVRVPMAVTLGTTVPLDASLAPSYNTNQYELGNVTTFLKGNLFRTPELAVSAGLGFAAPTANNSKLTYADGSTALILNNQAWHLLPYIGSVYTPNNRMYGQTMLQVDIDANGNNVQSADVSGQLQNNGTLRDPTYLFASVGGGYWFYQSPAPYSHLSRASVISELHFNSTLQPTNTIAGSVVQIGSSQSQIQTLNAVLGTNVMFDQNKSLLLGYVVPIGADQAFAGEFRVLFNWYFGTINRQTRVQF